MSRRSTPLSPRSRDGTSQRSRRLAALDPAYAPIDDRTSADLLGFVRAYADRLWFVEADPETGELRADKTWLGLVRHADAATGADDISIADIVAYVADPTRFAGERARWLGRPHFALLLAFVELLGHARDLLNGLTRRHLDHYYREVLQLRAEPPTPDRAMVVIGLSPGATEVRLPAGTELQAGRDAGGPLIYRTEREIVANRATVAQLRSVFVDRRITGIPDVRADRDLTGAEALTRTLRIALGSPQPGDAIPPFDGTPIDTAFLLGLRPLLDFADASLRLQHNELRSLIRRYHRRRDADADWAQVNRLLGVTNPARPRDFAANLFSRVGKLDFKTDGLPQVDTVDDLALYSGEPDVRRYIDSKLAAIGFDNFIKAMKIKHASDADWAEILRLLERMGQRQRGQRQWTLPPGAPTRSGDPIDFAASVQSALSNAWPPPWPTGTGSIESYDALLRRLEIQLSMPVEQIATLVRFAKDLGDPQAERHDWTAIDHILAGAYREKLRAARQAQLATVRGGQDAAAFEREANFVLGITQPQPPLSWTTAQPQLKAHIDAPSLAQLDQFRTGLATGQPISGFGWSDADRLFERAWRHVQQLPDPVAQKIELHNVYAYDDATQVRDSAVTPGWKTLGGRPATSDDQHPQGATLGWALRSPLLALGEGTRTLTLTLGLRGEHFRKGEQDNFLKALGLNPDDPADRTEAKLIAALQHALAIEVSTAKGWIALDLAAAQLAPAGKLPDGKPAPDYWSVSGATRKVDEVRPALQLQVKLARSVDPLAPLKGETAAWPALRLSLKPSWDSAVKEYRTAIEAFQPLVLAAVHLKVDVDGLAALHLQQDDREIDPRKPFEPFGSRPAVGARLYIEHPELVRARLDTLRFDIEWMGLPADGLPHQYKNYPQALTTGSDAFKARVVLIDRNLELDLGPPGSSGTGNVEIPLFEDKDGKTSSTHSLSIGDVSAAIRRASSSAGYDGRSDLAPSGDIRLASRYLRWELTPVDFGHAVYPSVAAGKARDLAVAIANKTANSPAIDSETYRVDPPYTPTIKSLRVFYTTSVELDPTAAPTEHQVLHVHPFGVCPIDRELPSLLPRYEGAGELYIGIRDLRPPQHLTLLLQLAEGTSDPDVEPAAVTWSYLDGDRFRDLSGSGIVDEPTRGLINSGIVELALPAVAPSTRLPSGLYWLRIALPRNPTSVCDVVAIRAQAVAVRFEDRGNAAAHYQQPLPVGSIKRLVHANPAIARIEQPYSSFGGRPAEPPELFDTRVSERLRHKDRALSAWDYERLVLHGFRQIYKAKCLATEDGIDVVVIPDIRELHPSDTFAPRAPANLLADIEAHLVARAPAAARIRVRNARYVAVQVRLGVRFTPGIDQGFAQRRLNDDLVRFLSPWAFDDGAELMIGGRIYANSILDFVDRRDYVDFVAEIKLFRSTDGKNYDPVLPVTSEYHVATDRPDQVLVAAQQHYVDIIPETGFQPTSFIGINYARIELDFIVGEDKP